MYILKEEITCACGKICNEKNSKRSAYGCILTSHKISSINFCVNVENI